MYLRSPLNPVILQLVESKSTENILQNLQISSITLAWKNPLGWSKSDHSLVYVEEGKPENQEKEPLMIKKET